VTCNALEWQVSEGVTNHREEHGDGHNPMKTARAFGKSALWWAHSPPAWSHTKSGIVTSGKQDSRFHAQTGGLAFWIAIQGSITRTEFELSLPPRGGRIATTVVGRAYAVSRIALSSRGSYAGRFFADPILSSSESKDGGSPTISDCTMTRNAAATIF